MPTLLVSLARSGDSPESTAATAIADELLSTVRHVVITCNRQGHLAKAHSERADSLVLFMPAAANDRGFAMTSSFTSMLLAAQLTLDPDSSSGRYVDQLGAAADRLLSERTGQLAGLAARRYRRVVFLGSGALTGLAREAALKLLELTAGQVVSYWDSPLGFRHGPKAILEQETLCVVFVSTDPYTRRYDQDIADELRHALGDEHVIEVSPHASDERPAWHIGDLGHIPDPLVALPYAVLAQQFALLSSLELGLTPDDPIPVRRAQPGRARRGHLPAASEDVTDFFLGCDGGGTKTDLAVVTGEGRLAGYLRAPSTYYLSSRSRGIELVGEVLDEAVPAVCAQAKITPGDVRFAFFGLPGYGEVRADVPRIDAAAAQALRHGRLRCDNNMVCGWAG